MSTKVWLLALLIFVPKLSDGQVTDCNLAAIDLVFVLDASGSIGATNFQMILSLVRDIVTSLEIGSDEGQVAVIRFASTASVIFGLTANDNEADLLNAVNGVTFTGGGTDIAAALNLLVSSGFAGARPESQGIPRFAVVVTDGESNLADTTAAAAAVRAVVPEITCFAVGIGASINLAELEQIASRPTTTFLRTISGFNVDELENLTRILRLEACRATVILTIGEKVERGIGQGQVAFFRYQVPAQGFTIQVIVVVMGRFAICGSTTIEQPSCSDPSLHDWRREVTGFVDVYITPDGLDADSLPVGRPRPTAVPPNLQIFVTVEGLDMNNDLCFNTTLGDTRIPRVATTQPPTTQPPTGPSIRVNDTVTGDPLMTVPLFVGNSARTLLGLGEGEHVSLCYEVHGEANENFSLVSDVCVSVNAHYVRARSDVDINIINTIGVRAVDSSNQCHNIRVDLDGCRAFVDGVEITTSYSMAGISVRRNMNRVRIAVPNCEDHDLVMWVFCLNNTFTYRGLTFQAPMIRFVIARGLSLLETSHGIIGQFWNIPIEVVRYSQPFGGNVRSDTYAITVNYPGQTRQFVGLLHPLTWELDYRQCLYVGNRQGGPIDEVSDPNDPVLQGKYEDYEVDGLFDTQFEYGHFEDSRC